MTPDLSSLRLDRRSFKACRSNILPHAREENSRWAQLPCRVLAIAVAAGLSVLATEQPRADETTPVKIAVFDFVLDDKSAGGSIVASDAIDIENLKKSTSEARGMLSGSDRYTIVDASSTAAELESAGGVLNCSGCEGSLARKLGADQSMVGIVTRVARTEYALQVLVRDAGTGKILSNDYTGLRLGANYSWLRSVKWLMNRKILPARRWRVTQRWRLRCEVLDGQRQYPIAGQKPLTEQSNSQVAGSEAPHLRFSRSASGHCDHLRYRRPKMNIVSLEPKAAPKPVLADRHL